MHFIDPIKMLEVGSEHEDGKEVDAQFWIVHVSKRCNQIKKILKQNKCICWKLTSPCEVELSLSEENLPLNLRVLIPNGFPENKFC